MDNHRKANILIVDDSLDNLRLLSQILEEKGYKVRPAPTGPIALRSAQASPPDLVLLDIMMPGLDGYQICHQLKTDRRTQNIPIIFVSALNQAAYKVSGLSVGAVDFISKPYEPSELLARIEVQLELRKAQQQLAEKNLALQRAQTALHQANQTLEQKVAERTRELEQTNGILQEEVCQREQAQHDLSITARRFQSLVEYSSDLIAVLDEAGIVRYVSSSSQRILGYASTDLVGCYFRDFVTHSERQLFNQTITQLRQKVNAVASLQISFLHQDGRQRYLTGTAKNLLTDKTVGGILINVHDITERHHAEAELQRHRNRLKELVTERTIELEKRVRELSLLNTVTQMITRGGNFQEALELVSRSLVKLYACQKCGIALLNDNQASLTVAAEYSTLSNLTSTVGEIIPIFDNPSTLEVFNTKNPAVFYEAKTNPKLATIHHLMEAGQVEGIMIVPLLARDKVIGTIGIIISQLDRSFTSAEIELAETIAGQIAGVIDSARLLAEEQRQRQRAEQQNIELEAFSHTVAHDVKHPLSVIYTLADLAEEMFYELEPEEVLEKIATMKQYSMRGVTIVDELLLLAKVREEDVPTEQLDMPFIIRLAQQRLQFMFREYQGQVILPDSWPTVLGYEPWVTEVWINYISNGLKYGGPNPCLQLGATVQDNGFVRFWIQDDGPGIPEHKQAALFTKFTRVGNIRVEGHGLGLSIVRRIIEKLGGQVGVESEEGQGSTFYFMLPQAPSST